MGVHNAGRKGHVSEPNNNIRQRDQSCRNNPSGNAFEMAEKLGEKGLRRERERGAFGLSLICLWSEV
jgi:hypothetical protein